MHLQRVVEVWNPTSKKVGTGYLVADHLVLTAHHNVSRSDAGGDARVEIRRLGLSSAENLPWVAARVVWPAESPDLTADPGSDAALLLITGEGWQPPDCPPVTWGRLAPPGEGRGRVDCVAVGFPQAEARDGRRDTKEIRGHIEALTGLKSGLIHAHVDQVATPHGGSTASRWAGTSGAALFCGATLVGILVVDRAQDYPATLLTAVPVAGLAARPGFTTTIKATGGALTLQEVTSFVGHAPASAYAVEAPAGLNNLPDLPSRFFVGRSEALHELAAALNRDSQAITQTVHGLGGVGKSTLALHYAHTHLDTYRLVWWIHADTPDLITADLAALAGRLRGGRTGDLTTPQAADWAVGWLQAHPGWLLVLDNAEHPSSLVTLTGQLRHAGRHLITSRYTEDWPTEPLALPVLAEDASLELLTRFTGLTDPANQGQARLLAEELGHLPLALEQAGAFIRQSKQSVKAYRDLLHERTAYTVDIPADHTRPERTMARIWRVTLDALAELDPLTVRILRVVAWFAPRPLPRDLLSRLADNPARLTRALGLLGAYSMITLESDTLAVHRLVQTIARTPDPAFGTLAHLDPDPHRAPDAIETARRDAAVLLTDALPEDPQANIAGWPRWRALLPHIQALADATEPTQDTAAIEWMLYESAVFMLNQGLIDPARIHAERSVESGTRIRGADQPQTFASRLLQASLHEHTGDLDRAIELGEAVLADIQRVLGPHCPEAMAARNNLATACQRAGKLGRSTALFEAALAEEERVPGADQQRILIARSNLAGSLRDAGDLEKAIALYETTLAELERTLGTDHPATLSVRSRFAFACELSGDLSRAISLYATTTDDSERVLGADHPDTLAARDGLAGAYESAGDLGQAIPLYEELLGVRLRVLGADHPDTLTSRNNLAYAYGAAGDLARAVPLHESTLADQERVLGADHPATLSSRNNLACLYEDLGDLDHAVSLLETTLADRERVLGTDHPHTLDSRELLACAYASMGDLRRAVPLHEANLADRKRVLGADHPATLSSVANLAKACGSAGDRGRSISLYVATLADCERVLGFDHPDTLSTRNNLAHAYQAAGSLTRAIPLFEETLADSKRVLGADHPRTFNSRSSLAGAYLTAGDLGRAIPLFEETLADRKRVLGVDHPGTLSTRIDAARAYQAAGYLAWAIRCFESTLADHERVLGVDHLNTLTARSHLACAYHAAKDPVRAIPQYEAALAGQVDKLGTDHPSTLCTLNNLAGAYQITGNLPQAISMYEAAYAGCERVHGVNAPLTRAVRGNLIGAYLERAPLWPMP
ncbi:FxSxx-COOH system tetratricopeptide repeat protein [Streptomyces sp. SP18BB07]|uniref:FxSxx-COOH system tetratricopeptide repeat protein n=1 Tax=Streptomyces sp. SP18BB07 TaxID=3002522 RepID=UPI002E76DB85|nr:FxSxx-COOH system tetratricopeptide repeat protein [Streptomyces sp. SP18BB07]MEE1764212.1 FxSxx-COOH system tetratricopeptide repeat protein [Streptomyces sp. SP18BB07]